VFTTPAATTSCKKVSYGGSFGAKTTAELTITPTYSECTMTTIFGNFAATVDFKTNECDYRYTTSGEFHLICNKPEGLILNSAGCKITYPSQTVSKVIYGNSNAGTSRDIGFGHELSGMTSTATGPFCSTLGNSTSGTYAGGITVKGLSSGVQVGIWYE